LAELDRHLAAYERICRRNEGLRKAWATNPELVLTCLETTEEARNWHLTQADEILTHMVRYLGYRHLFNERL
jgi:hypothetical protein